MSDKYITSFYIDDGSITYPERQERPGEDRKVIAKLLADGPFLEWLNDEIKEQTEIGTEDSRDSFKGRWNAYQLKRIRSKYLGIMNGLAFEDAYGDVIDRLWTPVEVKNPSKDGWYIATLDGKNYGDDGRTVDVCHFLNGRWVDAEGYDEKVYAWLDVGPYEGGRI